MNKTDINRHAKAIGTELSFVTDGYEYSSIIYQQDGYVGKTPLFTSNESGGVDVDTDAVPAGATIIAVVHNHPDRDSEIDKTPSPRDSGLPRHLYEDSVKPGVRWKFDNNMIIYIFDHNSKRTYAYDRKNWRTDVPTCYL